MAKKEPEFNFFIYPTDPSFWTSLSSDYTAEFFSFFLFFLHYDHACIAMTGNAFCLLQPWNPETNLWASLSVVNWKPIMLLYMIKDCYVDPYENVEEMYIMSPKNLYCLVFVTDVPKRFKQGPNVKINGFRKRVTHSFPAPQLVWIWAIGHRNRVCRNANK